MTAILGRNSMKSLLADLAIVAKLLAVVTTANAIILGYFAAHFPQYVVIASDVLAGVVVVAAVLQSVVNTFVNTLSVSRIVTAQIEAGAMPTAIEDLTAAIVSALDTTDPGKPATC
jgi:hypothetical protein